MATVELNKTDVVSQRVSPSEVVALNTTLIRNDYDGIDLDKTLAASGCTLVGTGLLGQNGESYIESEWEKIREATCYLVECNGKYANLWVRAESGENGFDDQVELHFDN